MTPVASGRVTLRTSLRLLLAAGWLPLVACGGGTTGPDPIPADVERRSAPQPVSSPTPPPAAPDATCDIKGFKVEPLNFVGQTVLPKVIRVRVGNPQPACGPLRLTVWDATNIEDQKFVRDSSGRFPPNEELSVEIPCGMFVQIDLNNSPDTPDGARYSPGYFVKGWHGTGPSCPVPTPDPTPTPTPPPTPTLACTPDEQAVGLNEPAHLSAQGGNGQYAWSVGDGSPSTGSGSAFATRFGAPGTRTVTVTSAGQSRTCRVKVAAPPTEELACTPDDQTVAVGETASLTARGGDGRYEWSAPGGSPANGSGSRFQTEYGASGTKTITLTSGSQTRTCRVKVPAPPSCDDTTPPYSTYTAQGSVTHIGGGRGVDVQAVATLVNGRYEVKLMARSGSQEWVKDQESVTVECREGRRTVSLRYRNESAHGSSQFWVRIDPVDGGRHPTRDFVLN